MLRNRFALIPTTLILGALSGAAAHALLTPEPKLNSERYGRERLGIINQHLMEAESAYVFVAGDSHAELVAPSYLSCGSKTVNGGISGATAETYSTLLGGIAFATAPTAVVLTIGTNDLLRKKAPGKPQNVEKFARTTGALIRRLQAIAPRVIVNAIPPVGVQLEGYFDIAAIETYSQRLRDLCGTLKCEFVDPFSELRSEEFGIATAGSMRDALHLASYGRAFGKIAAQICHSPARAAQGG